MLTTNTRQNVVVSWSWCSTFEVTSKSGWLTSTITVSRVINNFVRSSESFELSFLRWKVYEAIIFIDFHCNPVSATVERKR